MNLRRNSYVSILAQCILYPWCSSGEWKGSKCRSGVDDSKHVFGWTKPPRFSSVFPAESVCIEVNSHMSCWKVPGSCYSGVQNWWPHNLIRCHPSCGRKPLNLSSVQVVIFCIPYTVYYTIYFVWLESWCAGTSAISHMPFPFCTAQHQNCDMLYLPIPDHVELMVWYTDLIPNYRFTCWG